jgi:hypothetical protein
MGHLRIGAAVFRPRGGSVRVPGVGTPGGLVKRFARAVLWLLVAVLLLRGLASVIEPREPAPVVAAERSAPASWPDDAALAFAADFARAYLSYSPRDPDAWARAVQAYAVPELAASIAPEYDEDAPQRAVGSVIVARTVSLDAGHALVTVAAAIQDSSATRYLTVPVARDAAGGLAVSDLPSFAAAPARASLNAPPTHALPSPERAVIESVVSRFLEAYLAGDASGLEYLMPAGSRIVAPQLPHELVDVGSVSLAAPAAGRERLVLAAVRARDARSGVVFSLRYRLRLLLRDRWYVADVNNGRGR